jgi:hypothetical protein
MLDVVPERERFVHYRTLSADPSVVRRRGRRGRFRRKWSIEVLDQEISYLSLSKSVGVKRYRNRAQHVGYRMIERNLVDAEPLHHSSQHGRAARAEVAIVIFERHPFPFRTARNEGSNSELEERFRELRQDGSSHPVERLYQMHPRLG